MEDTHSLSLTAAHNLLEIVGHLFGSTDSSDCHQICPAHLICNGLKNHHPRLLTTPFWPSFDKILSYFCHHLLKNCHYCVSMHNKNKIAMLRHVLQLMVLIFFLRAFMGQPNFLLSVHGLFVERRRACWKWTTWRWSFLLVLCNWTYPRPGGNLPESAEISMVAGQGSR